jgi:WD40 repeat protein
MKIQVSHRPNLLNSALLAATLAAFITCAPLPAEPPPRREASGAAPELALRVGHGGRIWALQFSPDGQQIATAADDGLVKLWDTASGELCRSWLAHLMGVQAVAFSPDGRRLATAGYGASMVSEVKVWDLRTGALRWVGRDPTGSIDTLCFSRDDHALVSQSRANGGFGGWVIETRFWNARTGRERTHFRVQGLPPSYSADLKTIAVLDRDRHGRLYNTESGRLLCVIDPGSPVTALTLSPDGRFVASDESEDAKDAPTMRVRLWEPRGSDLARGLAGPASLRATLNGDFDASFSPDGRSLLCRSETGMKVRDPRTGALRRSLPESEDISPRWMSVSDGARIVAAPEEGSRPADGGMPARLAIWDTAAGVLVRRISVPGGVERLALSPGGRLLATSGDRSAVRLWDVPSGALQHELPGGAADIRALCFSPDGSFLAAASSEGHSVNLWNVLSGRLEVRLAHRYPVQAVAFTPGGLLTGSGDLPAAAGSASGELRRYDAESGWRLVESRSAGSEIGWVAYGAGAELTGGPEPAAVSADGHLVAIARPDAGSGMDRLFIGEKMVGSGMRIGRVTASGDGRVVAIDGWRGWIQLWDARPARLLRDFRSSRASLALSLSPDGSVLAVAGMDGSVDCWEARTGRQLRRIELGDLAVALAFSPDGALLAIGGDGGRLELRRASTGAQVATLMDLPPLRGGTPDREWIAFTPGGDYDGSPGASAFLRWRVGADLLPAIAFEDERHRPERLREALDPQARGAQLVR